MGSQEEELKILELFSGIGGMHFSFKYSCLPGKVIAAMDINPIANNVYKHNEPKIQMFNNNIQKLTAKIIKKLEVNTILMSPPCQPFTRVGKQKDIEDNRTDALKHICDILPDLDTIDYILMENVKGFEKSQARNLYTNALENAKFFFREFILSPSQFGVPNTRHRYFCLARRNNDFNFDKKLLLDIPNYNLNLNQMCIKNVLEENKTIPDNLLLTDDMLRKRVTLLDIVTPDCKNTICFTKAYTHYSEGTGSVFSPLSKSEINSTFQKAKVLNKDTNEYLSLLKNLKLRYFTPREVLRLMSFPEEFQFPDDTTNRQKYRLIGNSINVLLVGELIKILVRD